MEKYTAAMPPPVSFAKSAGKYEVVPDDKSRDDDDGNGTINKMEFRKVLPALGLQVDRAVAEELFDSFDADKSGEIDYKELHHGGRYHKGKGKEFAEAMRRRKIDTVTSPEPALDLSTGQVLVSEWVEGECAKPAEAECQVDEQGEEQCTT